MVLLAADLHPPRAQEGGSALAGGASFVEEGHGEWRLSCAANASGRQCAILQDHRQQDGRRLLAIAFEPAAGGGLEGTLTLPFGLALSEGATLAVDGRPLGERLDFSTCLPAGCIVPVALGADAVGAMRAGETLTLSAVLHEEGGPLTFSVPLTGLGPALGRAAALLE